jgi:hypothetical protein
MNPATPKIEFHAIEKEKKITMCPGSKGPKLKKVCAKTQTNRWFSTSHVYPKRKINVNESRVVLGRAIIPVPVANIQVLSGAFLAGTGIPAGIIA